MNTWFRVGVVYGGFCLGLFLKAFVVSWLWHWYAVPFGVMELDFFHAVGVVLLVSFLTTVHRAPMYPLYLPKSYLEKLTGLNTSDVAEIRWHMVKEGLFMMIFNPLFVLFVGWLFS
jgi:hypothetical protein